MSPQSRLFAMMKVDKTDQLIEQVRQLHKQSINALVATLAVLFYVAYRIRGDVADTWLWAWVATIVAINLYLLVWIVRLSRHGLNRDNVHGYLAGYQLEAILHGTAWGMLPFLLADTNDPLHQLFSYYVICGMAAGAIATTAMIYRIYLSFMLPMMLPSIVWQVAELGLQIFDMGAIGLLLIFVVAMLFLSHAHYDSVLKTIRLIQQNDDLVDSLRSEAQRSKAANRAKTEFLSNTSHELRTPLNAIMGFSRLLMKLRQPELPEKAREYVHSIHQAGTHLSDLINQVLDLAKIESDKARAESRSVDIKELLADCIRLMRPLAVEHQVQLKEVTEGGLDGDGGAGVYVLADPMRLRQVVINLISNAVKYNRPGGEVAIHCRLGEGSVNIEVEDTGLGIPAELQQEIFTPFTRGHQHLNVEGTGIGLAVTRKNLELMGSDIQWQSRDGGGSRFWFNLPRTDTPPELVRPEPVEGGVVASGHDIHLLYVEDNPLGIRLMQEVMKQEEGITLHCAETGEEGYRLALETLPDVIILDINLPDISGMEVMRRLRAEPRTQQIPVLALSASALSEDVERGLRAGFADYLKKPCLPDEIVRRVVQLANQGRASGTVFRH